MSAQVPSSALNPRVIPAGLPARLELYRRPAILLLVAAAFWLRLVGLDSQALRGDEAATVHYSALPVTELWELSRVTDPHPPLYYLLLHPWQWGLGEDAWTMRFAGVLASSAAVAALYALARRTLGSLPLSLLAAGLLAVNPLQIWLAQDIRSYPLFTLLGLLSAGALWQALRICRDVACSVSTNYTIFGLLPSRLVSWLVYVLLTVACFYTHYYTVFLIIFEGLFVLLNARKFWAARWPWLISQVIIGLAILPGLRLAANFADQAAGGIDTLATGDILRLASTALLTGFTIDESWGLWLSLLLAPLWLAGLLVLLRRDFTGGSFWVLFFALPVLGVIGLSIGRPFFKERFLIQAQPAFELLLAAGFLAAVGAGGWGPGAREQGSRGAEEQGSRGAGEQGSKGAGEQGSREREDFLFRRPLRFKFYVLRFFALLLLAALLAGNFLALRHYFADPAYAKATPWHLYGDHVGDHARPGDVVLTNFPEASVSYYSPNTLPFYVVPAERDRPVAERIEQAEQIAGAYRRLWFLPLQHEGFDEQGAVLSWLDRHADRVDQIFFPSYNLNLYLAPPALEEIMVPQPALFAHGLQLRGYQVLDEAGDSRLVPAGKDWLLTLAPGDTLTLSLYWLAGGSTAEPYTVFTHLVAADGFTRTGRDNQPVWGSYPTTEWRPDEKITDKYTLTLPAGTPSGDHRLHLGWYGPDPQARVPLLEPQRQPPADHLILDLIIRVK